MEKLKSVVPNTLKQRISESTPNDLPSTCSSLLDFFHQLPHFHHMVRDLTDPEMGLCGKNKEAALESKQKGNECFSKGDYPSALSFYSQALRVAPADANDMGKNLVAMLYVNRASVFHKMGLLVECLRDCDRALVISSSYAKAWYRRGKANAAAENYEDAVRDLTIAMNMQLSSGGKQQIESELKLIIGQRKGASSSLYKFNKNNPDFLDEPQTKLECVYMPAKGRGMASLTDIPQASLVHKEEPYAAIILKHCRETHCHFCLNELPSDTVPCSSCSMPLYCSQQCQGQAGGKKLRNDTKSDGAHVNVSGDLEKYIADITLDGASALDTECIVEHRHECQGVNWPAVLPSEIVLAGRVLVKSVEEQRHFSAASSLMGNLELCHNYVQLPSESKLDFHIQSIILLHCLQISHGSKFLMNGITVSQCVLLLSQIKVNSMAIVRMIFLDVDGQLDQSQIFSSAGDSLTSAVEQVRVGQAIYSSGSLFNHSCKPNIHSYFLSRTLFIRSTEFVTAGYPLELSYGPQVGEWDCKDRQQFLKDQYSFRCQCSGCAEINLSDLVLNAFRCVRPNCVGVVLNSCVAKYEKQKVNPFLDAPTICSAEPHMQLKNDIKMVACHMFEEASCANQLEPGCCLCCGSYRDLEASIATVNKAETYNRRLKDKVACNKVITNTISDALRSLDLFRSTLHAYNKKIAEAEDNLALAFCMVGELKPSRDHCMASIKILEKLYGPNQIVIGNELVKLISIQLSLGDSSAVDSINRVDAIFSLYYGSHADIIFPHLQRFKREAACKF